MWILCLKQQNQEWNEQQNLGDKEQVILLTQMEILLRLVHLINNIDLRGWIEYGF